jgi:CheY-like chemotaxis protein
VSTVERMKVVHQTCPLRFETLYTVDMSNASTEKTKILLVDDDKLLLDIYARKFQSKGFEFSALASADGNFVETVATVTPDVILLDISFGGSERSGVDAAALLQQDARTKSVPIIFLTNADNETLAQKAKETSAIGFFVKDALTPSELVSKVSEFYTEYSQQRKKV